MCGIAAIFSMTYGDPLEALAPVLVALAHRGITGPETGAGDGWAMGAIRLPIVGREQGRQPIQSADGSVTVVLNGEIYNHARLRAVLECQGYVFRTDCDTEVLAHGYHFWGASLFPQLDGIFALVIHDARDGSHVAARDPLGVKPLYHVSNAHGAYYASEIKALLACDGTIAYLPPGHYRVGSEASQPYRPAPEPAAPLHGALAYHAQMLRQLVRAAVQKRVATDLPVAVLLSGGIDSSVVMYEAALAHDDVTAFSIGADDGPDALAAQRLCRELGLRHRHITVDGGTLLASVPETIWTIESFEPNHIRGGTLSFHLSKEVARLGYRLALCGEGADELFGGYPEMGAAVQSGLPDAAIAAMLARFVAELHRTQLQRVDRTAMRFALEVREPFLDLDVVEFAARLPLAHKIAADGAGRLRNKRVLREAWRGLLPDWVVDRDKAVLSLGAGFGSNGPEGLFYQHGLAMMPEEGLQALRARFPAFALANREEAWYFSLYCARFGALPLGKQRPLVNTSVAEP